MRSVRLDNRHMALSEGRVFSASGSDPSGFAKVQLYILQCRVLVSVCYSNVSRDPAT